MPQDTIEISRLLGISCVSKRVQVRNRVSFSCDFLLCTVWKRTCNNVYKRRKKDAFLMLNNSNIWWYYRWYRQLSSLFLSQRSARTVCKTYRGAKKVFACRKTSAKNNFILSESERVRLRLGCGRCRSVRS